VKVFIVLFMEITQEQYDKTAPFLPLQRGVLAKVFDELQRNQIVRIKVDAISLDSTIVKVHPDGTGA
jgi:hypothetical protein